MVFLSTKSLPCTTQCRGHFAAWEWHPCQGGLWLWLEWKFPMLQTLLHWEWVQCPGSTHARAGALGLSLLKTTWTKKILEVVRELTGTAPCPRNSTTLASTCNHPAALRWKRVCTQHTNVTMHGSCQVLYQALDNLQGFQICVSQNCSLKNRTKNAALSSSFGLILALLFGRVVKQIGKLIKLRTSLGFWHHVDVVICERTTLPVQSVGSRDSVPPTRWKAGQLGLIQEHPISCFHPHWWETQLWTRSSSEPHSISELWDKCNPTEQKSLKAADGEV